MLTLCRRRGLLASLWITLVFAGCAATPRYVVTVRFQTRLSEAEMRERYPKRMPEFRKLPGLIQKYYLHDAKTGEWSGIYFWESMTAVEDYMKSDLKRTIAKAYDVVGAPRVELMELVDTLR